MPTTRLPLPCGAAYAADASSRTRYFAQLLVWTHPLPFFRGWLRLDSTAANCRTYRCSYYDSTYVAAFYRAGWLSSSPLPLLHYLPHTTTWIHHTYTTTCRHYTRHTALPHTTLSLPTRHSHHATCRVPTLTTNAFTYGPTPATPSGSHTTAPSTLSRMTVVDRPGLRTLLDGSLLPAPDGTLPVHHHTHHLPPTRRTTACTTALPTHITTHRPAPYAHYSYLTFNALHLLTLPVRVSWRSGCFTARARTRSRSRMDTALPRTPTRCCTATPTSAHLYTRTHLPCLPLRTHWFSHTFHAPATHMPHHRLVTYQHRTCVSTAYRATPYAWTPPHIPTHLPSAFTQDPLVPVRQRTRLQRPPHHWRHPTRVVTLTHLAFTRYFAERSTTRSY